MRIETIREALGKALLGKAVLERMEGDTRQSASRDIESLVQRKLDEAMSQRGPSPEEAARIAAYESSPLAMWNAYGAYRNAPEKTGVTVNTLRQLSRRGTIPEVCIRTRVNQAAAYAGEADGGKYGVLDRPSWRIRLARGKRQTDQDRANIAALTRFIAKNGWVEPPEAERPIGWEPSFSWTLKSLLRDSQVADWVPTMFWSDTENPDRFPVVAYSVQDADLYRRWVPDILEGGGGTLALGEGRDSRPTPTISPKRFVRLEHGSRKPVAWYTRREMGALVRNPSLETCKWGYGTSEVEDAIQAVQDMINILTHNASRFTRDYMPRGFISVLGTVSDNARNQFAMSWKQQMEQNMWGIPILSSVPPGPDGKGGHSVQWVPMDPGVKDMEFAQLYYQAVVTIHAAMRISPEETGLAEASPFSSSLSEASPEAYLKWSRSQFGHLMTDIARYINAEIIWRMPGGDRYLFDFVGLVEFEALQEQQLLALMLQNGAVTTREIWESCGKELPKSLAESDAVDLPMPLIQALSYLDQKEQMDMMQEQAEREQAEQEAAERAKSSGSMPAPPPGSGLRRPPAAGQPQAIAPAQPLRPASSGSARIGVSSPQQRI